MIQIVSILLIAIIIGMVTNAVNIITAPGNLFGRVQDNINEDVNNLRLELISEEIIQNHYLFPLKPLILCPPCMSSTWGSLTYWAIQIIISPFSGELMAFVCWPITILVGVYASYLFAKFNDNL